MGSDADLIDYGNLVSTMKQMINLTVCQWAKETTGAFGGAKWACKRDRSESDLCKQGRTTRDPCIKAISKIMNVKESKASDIYDELKEFKWIEKYYCGAVFFLGPSGFSVGFFIGRDRIPA